MVTSMVVARDFVKELRAKDHQDVIGSLMSLGLLPRAAFSHGLVSLQCSNRRLQQDNLGRTALSLSRTPLHVAILRV
jgi:hypothetical protein